MPTHSVSFAMPERCEVTKTGKAWLVQRPEDEEIESEKPMNLPPLIKNPLVSFAMPERCEVAKRK